MPFMTTDYSNNNDSQYTPLPTGEYEMVIKHAGETATKNGAESLQFDLVVRNDLDGALPDTNGKYHNRHLFVDNWKRKATNQYDMDGLQYYLQATKVPEGTAINSVDDFCRAMELKPVRVYVKVTEEEYNGETTKRNRVAPWNVSETQFPNVAHQWKDSTDMNASKPLTDEEIGNNLPF